MTGTGGAVAAALIEHAPSSALVVPAIKAAAVSAGAGVSQPLLIAVASLPPGGWLPYIQVGGTLVVAMCVAFVTWRIQTRQLAIAWQAAETSRNKLKLDLFDRRWKMYEAAQRLITTATIDRTVAPAALDAYCSATAGSKWIFNNGTQDYFEALADQVRALNGASAFRGQQETQKAYLLRVERIEPTLTWLRQQSKEIDKVVAPFMYLREGHVAQQQRDERLFTAPPEIAQDT